MRLVVKKIIFIFCILILVISALSILNENSTIHVTAYQETQNVVGLNWSFMESMTETLSNIVYIYDRETEIPKGRWFGTKGEQRAKELIMQNFTNWGFSPEDDKIWRTTWLYRLGNLFNVNEDLRVENFTLTHYNLSQSNSEEEITEWSVRPDWGEGSFWRQLRYKGSKYFKIFYILGYILGYDFINWDPPTTIIYQNMEILPRIRDLPNDILDTVNSMETNISIWKNMNMPHGFILGNVMTKMEDKYNFSFEDINTCDTNISTLPWYNSTIANITNYILFVGEDCSFNPDYKIYNVSNTTTGERIGIELEMNILCTIYPRFQGLILYENKYNAPNETYNFNGHRYLPKPLVYINRSKGLELLGNNSDYRVNYTLEQKWDDDISSYNIWADLNGTDRSKRLILGCLYDSVWTQGTCDSAVGMSIVMAIANYTREMDRLYGIKPKRDIRFMAWGAEEPGVRGASHYEIMHRKEEKKMDLIVLDLNQLGYNQKSPRQSLYIVSSGISRNLLKLRPDNSPLNKTSAAIASKTNLKERTDGYTNLTNIITQNPFPLPWINNTGTRWIVPSDYLPFYGRNFLPLRRTKTIVFIQEHDKQPYAMWRQHHRTGKNYNKGDSMEIYNKSFVNVTAELVWNFTKYFAYNPDCWFDGSESYQKGDSNADGKKDYVTVSFDLDTIMPHEKALVIGVLRNKRRVIPYRSQGYYTYDRDGTSGSITIKPWFRLNFPRGNYNLTLYLFNSSGIIDRELIKFPFNLSRWIMRKYADDIIYFEDFKMNNHVSNPTSTKPTSTGANYAGTTRTYTTTGSHPDSNQVYYQWEFTNLNTGTTEYTGWLGPYTSGQSHSYNYTWEINGTTQVRVRTRGDELYPNIFGNWSDVNETEMSKGVRIIAPVKVIVNQSFNVTGIPYGINASNHTWTWSFNQSEQTKEGQNQSHTYEVIQNNTVTLTVNDSSNNTYPYNQQVQAVPLFTVFNVSDSTVKPNENITFNSTYYGELAVNTSSWSWDFDDGNNSSTQNTTHGYNSPGTYNVTLSVKDVQDRTTSYTKQIIVDNDKPLVVSAVYTPRLLTGEDIIEGFYPYKVGIGENITFYVDLQDSSCNADSVYINITHPDETTVNLSMVDDSSDTYSFSLEFNDTDMIGYHSYIIWATDEANNVNYSSEDHLFEICHLFGQSNVEEYNESIEDVILGTKFKPKENGTADSITAYLHANLTTDPKAKCMLYYDDFTLLGTTEEKDISTGDYFEWITFEFSDPKPEFDTDNYYYITCWSDDLCNLSNDTTSEINGMRKGYPYGTPPSSVGECITTYCSYSIYCSYTNIPEIEDISHSPNTVGFGYNVTISANITDSSGIESVGVSFDYPNESLYFENVTMTNTENNTYQLVFDDTWWVGQYNYTIYATDVFGNINNSTECNFSVSANATISICTQYDSYQNGTIINLTDPPGDPPLIGYGLLDDGDVLRIWNKFDSYYFNTSSGIQITNHKDDYWSHNVLILGYYNNDQWNLIYRTDELSGFNKDIETDNETYVNATIWKNLTYSGYDFRLAIRYHLGFDDRELTVIPYIKNIDQDDIPYVLGFGWEMKDIQINMTSIGDYIDINKTMYYLNQTLDNTYTNLSESIYWWNESANESQISGYTDPAFYLRENITDTSTKSLYLRWNQTLTYKLQVKSRTGQYNAPVTLFIRIGTLNSSQEKYTSIYWYDADQVTYYFDERDKTEIWATNPDNMVDGNTENYASTTSNGDVELCVSNNCSGSNLGGISKVELRVFGYYSVNHRDIILRPVFNGTDDGSNYNYVTPSEPSWSDWFDITDDEGRGAGESQWSWSDVKYLDCDVEAESGALEFTLYCSKVELRVTYTNNPPSSNDPYPPDGNDGVAIAPTLNITVSDDEGDNMNITWLSNSSGSWVAFGWNNSVGNGTYHQTFSNATENGKWWYWKVNVSDSKGYTVSNVFKFYTGYQSKIANTGSYDCLGYLYMDVHKKNDSSGNWTVLMDIICDTIPLNLSTTGDNSTIAFDSMFNGIFNSSELWYYGNGTYRLYVAFMNPHDEVLVTDDSRKLEATYEFEVTFD